MADYLGRATATTNFDPDGTPATGDEYSITDDYLGRVCPGGTEDYLGRALVA